MPDYRAELLARVSAQYDGREVVNVDAQVPQLLTPAALGAWADARDVTLVAVVPWALALAAPDDNRRVQRTHARACEMDNVRSWAPDAPALADAMRIVETQVTPWLPLGAARRAFVVVERGRDPARTDRVVAALDARAAALRGRVSAATIAALVPDARAIANALAATALDFRAFAYLAKLVDAAAKGGAFPLVRTLIDDAQLAERLGTFFDDIERDRALMHFAYDWAADDALAPLVTYRGVRLDDLAVRLLLRRHQHPGYQHE